VFASLSLFFCPPALCGFLGTAGASSVSRLPRVGVFLMHYIMGRLDTRCRLLVKHFYAGGALAAPFSFSVVVGTVYA
jgi:hypothetical protein